jgi:predicted AAA+ superfamily ATPase
MEGNKMILKRKIYQQLLSWKNEQGQTALLIEGARRVGKSTIAETFAKEHYKSYIVIDFSSASDEIKSLFTRYGSNLDQFFFFLTTLTGISLHQRNSLIIFDEVQLFPIARQLIKQLVKDHRYDYIETGSLLSIKQHVQDILLPSEERAIKMYPLDFEEFCTALGREDLIPIMAAHFKNRKSMGELHPYLMTLFRQYLLIGGMPQAVIEYLKSHDYTKVERIKKDILYLYRNDIAKYAKGYETKVVSIFDNIPSQLSRANKNFKLSALSKNGRKRDYEEAFLWLDEAMIASICYNVPDPNVGLALHQDQSSFKMFMADTGLLLTHAFRENEAMHQLMTNAIVEDKLDFNQGMIFENIVAQMLTSQNKKLHYYAKTDNDNHANTMEIDFLIQDQFNVNKVSPIEVKSGRHYQTSSLIKFSSKFKKKLGTKYIIHTKDLIVKEDIIYLPIYMTSYL